MFENLTKETAEKFLELQENASDFLALTVIRNVTKKTEGEHRFIDLMLNFNCIINEMESGVIEWDSEINDYYRDGILLLINKCEAIAAKRETDETKKRLYAINIQWDVDNEEDFNCLPQRVKIPEGMTDDDEISDYLSDMTGFCHRGFSLVEA